MSVFSRNKALTIVLVISGLLFCSISLVNHYNFRTYAWDLGINNNAIYDYAHFRWNDCMLLRPQFQNVLSDHFTIYPILVSPFYWLSGSWTMLLFQIAAILSGGCGVYCYFKLKTDNKWIPVLASIHFFSTWGIFSALAFDYHDNVVAAMFVPWAFYFFEKKEFQKTFLMILLICIGKENMALWSAFICGGLFLLNVKEPEKRNAAALFSIFSIIYFALAVKVFIPSLANANREYLHFNYSALGDDFKEAFITIITKPKYVFDLLYENHTHNPDGDGAKSELHMMILLSGGLFLLFRPQFLIMLIPIYAQKLFNDDFVKWGINYQYSIEFSPILTLAAFTSIIYIKKYTTQLSLIITVLTFATTISSLDHRVSNWYMPELSRFYSTAHYTVDFDRREVVKAIAEIPANASVSATNSLVPHMAFRDYIYQYPDGKNCDYVVLLNVDNVYPLRRGMLYKDIKKLLSSPAYQCLHKTNRLYIFKKLR